MYFQRKGEHTMVHNEEHDTGKENKAHNPGKEHQKEKEPAPVTGHGCL
jgi:hypothetical protein